MSCIIICKAKATSALKLYRLSERIKRIFVSWVSASSIFMRLGFARSTRYTVSLRVCYTRLCSGTLSSTAGRRIDKIRARENLIIPSKLVSRITRGRKRQNVFANFKKCVLSSKFQHFHVGTGMQNFRSLFYENHSTICYLIKSFLNFSINVFAYSQL